jgi:hypothetical protein
VKLLIRVAKCKGLHIGQETGFDLGLMDEPYVADKFDAGLKLMNT